MAMGTHPIPFHAHGKENFGPTTPSSLPRPPRPSPARWLTGSTRPPSTDGPKMAAARPTPPARPLSCPWLGPARRARLPRAGPAALPVPPGPRCPGPGPALPSPWRRSCSCGRPPAPRPDRKRKDSSPFRHYVYVPPPSDSRFCRAGRSTPDTQPESGIEL